MLPLSRNNVSRAARCRGRSRAIVRRASQGDRRARPPRRHRPEDPEGAAGRRPHDQCGAGAPGRHFGAALPAARARAGGGRLHQGLPRRCSTRSCWASRSRSSPWCTCPARPRPTSRPSRNSCGRSRWCANAGCCRARSTSSSNAWRPTSKTFQAFVAELTGGAACAQRQDLADAAQLQGRRHGAAGAMGKA